MKHLWTIVIASSLLIVGCWGLGYLTSQHNFYRIILFYSVAFGGYALCFWSLHIKNNEALRWEYWLIPGVIARLALLFAFPALSDDVYRFFWDAKLLLNGINPFLYTPAEFLYSGFSVAGIDQEFFEHLNSPDYHTIYPPVSQWVYSIGAFLSPMDVQGAAVWMKVCLFIAELVTLYGLVQLTKAAAIPPKNALIYFLNPLIIVEIIGNLHFEGLMICFLVLSLFYFFRKKNIISGILLGCSIGVKMLPLMFLPLFIKRLSKQKLVMYYCATGITVVALFISFMNTTFLMHFSESLELYFQKFEFNASLYYLVRSAGYMFTGYNIIGTAGPLLGVVAFLGIFWLSFFKADIRLFDAMLLAFTFYLFTATTVHPWYLSTIIAISVFSKFRYPIFWSYLICFTYINYQGEVYFENLWVVAIEYILVVGIIAVELTRFNKVYKKKRPAITPVSLKSENS